MAEDLTPNVDDIPELEVEQPEDVANIEVIDYGKVTDILRIAAMLVNLKD